MVQLTMKGTVLEKDKFQIYSRHDRGEHRKLVKSRHGTLRVSLKIDTKT